MLSSWSNALISLNLVNVFVASISSFICRSSSSLFRLNLIRFLNSYLPCLLSLALSTTFRSLDFSMNNSQSQSFGYWQLRRDDTTDRRAGYETPNIPQDISQGGFASDQSFAIRVVSTTKILTELFGYVTFEKNGL